MKHLIIIIIILFAISLSGIELDKITHATCSYIIYDLINDMTYQTTNCSRNDSEGYAFWGTFMVGVGKEMYDVTQGQIFSEYDMVANMTGILLSLGMNRYIHGLEIKRMTLILNKNKIGATVEMRF